jgi:biopolymer transport protein ExbD
VTDTIEDTIEAEETNRYVSERKRRGRRNTKMQPPLTPMIDVTFQLLLYFLLTSTFKPDEGQIPGSLPEKGLSVPSPRPPIRIVLEPRGVNHEFVSYEIDSLKTFDQEKEEDLFLRLQARQQSGSATDETPVQIHPWSSVRWKYVVAAFNAAVRARYKNISFASGL